MKIRLTFNIEWKKPTWISEKISIVAEGGAATNYARRPTKSLLMSFADKDSFTKLVSRSR